MKNTNAANYRKITDIRQDIGHLVDVLAEQLTGNKDHIRDQLVCFPGTAELEKFRDQLLQTAVLITNRTPTELREHLDASRR